MIRGMAVRFGNLEDRPVVSGAARMLFFAVDQDPITAYIIVDGEWETIDVVADLTAHLAAGDPHPQYPLASAVTLALAGKAASSHSHAIADTTGLQTALDGKASSSHGHAQADVTDLVAALATKAATSHTHAIADTTGLQTALDAKAATTHAHAIADVTGLQAALDAKFGWTATVKQAADVTNATVTPVNTDLVFTFLPNSTYAIDLYLLATAAAATTGFGFALDVSVAVTAVGITYGHALANTGTMTGGQSIADDTNTGLSSGVPTLGVITPIFGGGLLVTGANGGTARLRFRPEVAASATLKAGSAMRVHKVA